MLSFLRFLPIIGQLITAYENWAQRKAGEAIAEQAALIAKELADAQVSKTHAEADARFDAAVRGGGLPADINFRD